MTACKNWSDEKVVEAVKNNFDFLTGARLPASKGTTKNAEGKTDAEWFHELSPLHMFLFVQAFHEANIRGLLNVGERALCQEVIDML